MKAQYDDLDEYIADLQEEVSKNENCANHQYNLGVAFISKGDFMAAEDALLAAVRASPRLAEAYIQLGGLCMQRDDLDGCLRYNEEAAGCRAKYAVPWGNIGFVHLQRGDTEKAITALQKAIKWDKTFIQAMATLGSAYFMTGEYDASVEISQKALALQPGFAPALNNLALAYFEKDDFAKAVEYADKAQEMGYDIHPEFLADLAKHRNT